MNFKPSSPRLDSQPKPDSTPKAAQAPVPQDDPVGELSPETLSLDDAMRVDRFRLKKLRRRLSPEDYLSRLARSVQVRRQREAFVPRLEYPEELPISRYSDEIVSLIRQRQVIVVCGETGSGKSTQLPKLCLEAGLGREGTIGHTQPRRLAARSIATRLSEELGCELGGAVGYQVRFGDQSSPETMIKLMTDGILLAETGSDRFLDQYDAIIIDEAHERSLNIDFLIAYLRDLQAKRPDLKLIITSATIDAERFAEHFSDEAGPAPIVTVEGRGYPVEIRYLPWEEISDDDRRYDLNRHVIAAIQNLSRSGGGDTLVFLPTERDIREVSHHVSGHYKRLGLIDRVEVLPLYARLPQKDQQKIFHPGGQRQRLIFATNVAESSLTVPGIRYVIDAGTARMSRYSPRSKLQRLPIEPVSRASADQRAGRCGRVGPGICVRLYSAEDFESRDAFTTPEIRRTNLASVVLQSKMLGFDDLSALPLLDVPRDESIREGVQTLLELGAIDDQRRLTPIGRTLGRMPVDPRIGRIILAAEDADALPEILPIAAALEIPDPRVRPIDQQQAADESHAEFRDPDSDFLGYLRLWKFYEDTKSESSRSKLTRVLRKRFLSPTRLREWADTYRQLRQIASESKRSNSKGKQSEKPKKRVVGPPRMNDDLSRGTLSKERYAAVHQALLTGFLSGVAMAGEKNQYIGPRNLTAVLWPGSGVFDSKPKWIVAAEWVETNRQYARTVARIQPQWIEQLAGHLLKASYSDPHWSQKANGAFCYQRLSLFGLPIVARRRTPLGPIDPATARDLLIQHGLVDRQLVTAANFVRHNRSLRDLIETLAAKTRRRDLVVDHYAVLQFYRERIPSDVCDRGRLEKHAKSLAIPQWTRQLKNTTDISTWLSHPPALGDDDGETCFMHPMNLLDVSSEAISEEAFPDELSVGKTELPLTYRYEPGTDNDGVSLRIHQTALPQISDDRLGWLVPGMLTGKVVAMIKSLPKRIRRNLVPAADVAAKVCEELMPDYGKTPFLPALCASLSRHAEMPVTPADFQSEKLEPHTRFLVEVVDDDGRTVASGRSADVLIKDFAGDQSAAAPDVASGHDEDWGDRWTTFEADSLPAETIRERGGVRVAMYPTLIDESDHVRIAMLPDQAAAEVTSRQGVARLYAMVERSELRRQVRWLPGLEEIKIRIAPVVPAGKLESALVDLLARVAFVEDAPPVRTREEFEARRSTRGERISVAVQEVATWLTRFGESYFELRRARESFSQVSFREAAEDVNGQIDWLLPESFLTTTPWSWLKHYPRYLAAVCHRMEKLRSGGGDRDRDATQEIRELRDRWLERYAETDRTPEKRSVDEFRWMLEELRVSLFAQTLGTSIKISPTRCKKWLDKA